jgi:hypothetical protein
MKQRLVNRLKEVYKSGRLYEYCEDALFGEDYAGKVSAAIARATENTPIRCDGNHQDRSSKEFEFAFTEKEAPTSKQWIYEMRNPAKLEWISIAGRFYPIFWFRVSRVYPAYDFYYNVWQPRGASGYLDAVIAESMYSREWQTFHEKIHTEMHLQGIELLTDDEFREKVDFVLSESYEDEDGNELPDGTGPRLRRVNVHECLFPEI